MANDSQAARQFDYGRDHGPPFSRGESATEAQESAEFRRDSPQPEARATPNGSAVEVSKGLKRKRGSNVHENQANGEISAYETNGTARTPQLELDTTRSDEPDSPTIEEIQALTTLSIGTSTGQQPEKIADMQPETTILTIDKPSVSLTHTLWSPTESSVLLTSGESVLRFYLVSNSRGDTGAARAEESSIPAPNGTHDITHSIAAPAFHEPVIGTEGLSVTDVCWTDPGEVVLAAKEAFTNDKGETLEVGKLISVTGGGPTVRVLSSSVGSVFALRWNPSSKLLLCISTTGGGGGGYVRVWRLPDTEPVSTTHIDHNILDAAWMTDSTFVVCGHDILLAFELDGNNITPLKSHDVPMRWEKVRHDPVCRIIACASTEDGRLGLLLPDADEVQISDPMEPVVGFDFQPIPNPASHVPDDPRLLAVSDTLGFITVWDAKRPFNKIHRVNMNGRPALSMAFSPDGYLFAAAGLDLVVVWQTDTANLPRATWKPKGDEWVDFTDEGEGRLEHSLSWDVDGKKLAYSLGNKVNFFSGLSRFACIWKSLTPSQIAVINFNR